LDEGGLIFASLAATFVVTEITILKALTVAIKAALTIVAPSLGFGTFSIRHVVIKKLLQ